MKYIKTFEENSDYQPKVGDYVIANLPKLDRNLYGDFIDFLLNNVGVISEILLDRKGHVIYAVYDSVQENIKTKFFYLPEIEILGNKPGYLTSIGYIEDHDIRLATEEEIEEYQIKKASNKYNI